MLLFPKVLELVVIFRPMHALPVLTLLVLISPTGLWMLLRATTRKLRVGVERTAVAKRSKRKVEKRSKLYVFDPFCCDFPYN